MIRRTSLLACGPLLAALAPTLEARTLLHAGRLFDGRSGSLRTTVTVAVDADRITGVSDGFVAGGPDDTVMDLRGATLLPGFIDLHVHITSQQSGAAGYAERFFLNPADVALRATTYARKTLLAGFTSVRDCGAGDKLNLALRDAAQKGWIVGPRIVAAGGVSTTGGHGDPTNGLASELQELLADRRPGVANGPDAVRAAVRQRYKDGADFIKIAATGVEHGTFMTDEVIAAMKERGTVYVPTISAGRFVAEKSKVEGYFPAVVRPKAAAIGPRSRRPSLARSMPA